ncbi:MAG: class I SAM-dependent methyltransferase, partial [bacterium]|nr:class I SAM-dependent methyltransferase [bacterium]
MSENNAGITSGTSCKLCGAVETRHAFRNRSLSMTSDSKTVAHPIDVRLCPQCQNLIKIHETKHGEIIAGINRTMQLHDPEGITQQRVAYDRYPGGIPRSLYQLEFIRENIPLTSEGKILDFGCHHGTFLRHFADAYNGWQVSGVDVSERFARDVRGIHEGADYSTRLEDIPGTFDLIVVSHTFEHLEDPVRILKKLREKLKPGGYLFLNTVDASESVFAPLVFEQYFHYSAFGLHYILEKNGCIVHHFDRDWMPKEIFAVARRDTTGESISEATFDAPEEAKDKLLANLKLLEEIERSISDISEKPMDSEMGVLGTAFAGTWAG